MLCFLLVYDGRKSVIVNSLLTMNASSAGDQGEQGTEGLDEETLEKAKLQAEFFDATLDDQDEAWVERQRQGRKSDGVLSCPACFTTLCLDCQRHEKYTHQYRAMFVTNCRVVESERLRLLAKPQQKYIRKGKPNGAANTESSNVGVHESEDAVFKPVRCSVCSTEVAVMDKEEVYHFFNVVPSYS